MNKLKKIKKKQKKQKKQLMETKKQLTETKKQLKVEEDLVDSNHNFWMHLTRKAIFY